MKKSNQILIVLVFLSSFIFAQTGSEISINKHPTSNWPFYFNDFVDATIVLDDDKESLTQTSININLFTGELQYLDGQKNIKILENINDVASIEVAGDLKFIFVDGFIQRVVVENKKYIVSERKKAKLSDLQSSTGAYGSSTNTAAIEKLNDKLIGGVNNFNYPSLQEVKEDGVKIDPEYKHFLISNEFNVSLNKRKILKQFPNSKNEISSFMKKEKIDLKDMKDVKSLIDYLQNVR